MRHPFAPLIALCLLLSEAAFASPAMIAARDGAERAERSFADFAKEWMAKEHARGSRASEAPRAHSRSGGVSFSYSAAGDDFQTELRPTGRSAAPWIGVIHYTEHTYTCGDALGRDCHVTSSLPVTEVFRFRGGRWGY